MNKLNELVELEHDLAVTRSLIHNASFNIKNKLGLIDHSLGACGPVGMPGCRGPKWDEDNQCIAPYTEEDMINYMRSAIKTIRVHIKHLEDCVIKGGEGNE